MSLVYIDGFEWIPVQSPGTPVRTLMERSRYYSQGSLDFGCTSSTAFSFGQALYANSNVFDNGASVTDLRYVHVNDDTAPEGIFGARVYIEADNASYAWPSFGFYDAVANIPLISISLQANGVIRVYRGRANDHDGTFLVASKAGCYRDQDWFYIEIKCKIASTGGYVQVRINTEIVLDLPAANTKPTGASGDYFDSYYIGGNASYGNGFQLLHYRLDDLYHSNLLGTENNDYLGNVRVKTQFLTANGSHISFTPVGAATNWQAASNTAVDDTKYNYSPNVGDYDLYDLQAIVNAPVVHGVQVRGAYRQDDATQRIAHNMLKAGTTLSEGSIDHYLNQSYTFYWDIWELNPDTGAGFTGTEVNALEIGPKVAA